jgi:hypothetical protein
MKETSKTDLANYVELAKLGHYPLFHPSWFEDSLKKGEKLSRKSASLNVKHVFNQLARHRTLSKKHTALLSMDPISREEFIRSFLYLVENNIKENLKTLQ